jgi:hypothetical protein
MGSAEITFLNDLHRSISSKMTFQFLSHFKRHSISLATTVVAFLGPSLIGGIFSLLLAGTASALQVGPNPASPSAAQEPEKQEEPADDWIKSQPEGARAQFKMPVQPVMKERMLTPVPDQPPIKIRIFNGTTKDQTQVYVFNYHDLHQTPADTAIEETLKEAMLQSLSSVRARLIAEQPIRYRTIPGKAFEYRFARGNEFYKGFARIFLAGNRHYQITVFMKEDRFDQQAADKFLNSFRLFETEPKTDKTQQDQKKSDNSATDQVQPDSTTVPEKK